MTSAVSATYDQYIYTPRNSITPGGCAQGWGVYDGITGEGFFWVLTTLIDIMFIGDPVEMRSVLGASQALEELVRVMPSKAHLIARGIVRVVSPGYLADRGIDAADERIGALQRQGKTVVFLLDGDRLMGVLALADTIRPEAEEAIRHLKAMDIRCMMLSGDHHGVVAGVAG